MSTFLLRTFQHISFPRDPGERFKKEDYAANIVQYLSDTELGAFAYYGTHMYLLFTGRNREEPEAVKRLITASCPKERVIDVR